MTYYSGFVLAVPEDRKDDYIRLARDSWPLFQRHGALRMVETWGVDVPRGTRTDFYRATEAQEGEVPLFSWVEWPDRATCDAAWAVMWEEGESAPMDMPFDGKRMFWGGFEPIFVSD